MGEAENSGTGGQPVLKASDVENIDDRADFYRNLQALRDQDLSEQQVRCAIIHYREPVSTLRGIGEWTGDQLYQAVRDQVLTEFDGRGKWYRIGRTRLGYVSTDFAADPDFEQFLDEFLGVLREPIRVNEVHFTLDVDIGATHKIQDPDDLDEVLFEIEACASLAGETEKSSYEFYEGGHPDDSFADVDVASELHTALEEDQFQLHYQPIVSLADGHIEGAEALVRWDHPEYGLVQPGSFIPQLEQSGLITFLGLWVLEAGISELAALDEDSVELSQMSVNLSPKQFRDPNLANKIENLLQKYSVEPGRLRLEITEQAMVTDREEARGRLGELIELGVQVAMDDFGTGYSSLSQITDLPVQVLKLDRSFVKFDSPSDRQRSVVDIIIEGGKTMQLQTLAEGIETDKQWNWLRGADCELAQGFFIAPGLPAAVFREWVKKYRQARDSGNQPPSFPPRALIREYLPEGFS